VVGIETLQQWAIEHEPENNLKFKDGYWEQIMFVRDRVSRLFGGKDNVFVVSTHTSKSVVLPVYRIFGDGITIQFRYNFHNVILSIVSEKPIAENSLMEIMDQAKEVREVYAEGFERDWVFGSFHENSRQWTGEIPDLLHLYVLLYRITHELRESSATPQRISGPADDIDRVEF
jgi:hypothetical protein